MESLNKLLNRIPLMLLTVAYIGYMGYDYWDWMNAPTSELGQKKAQIVEAKQAQQKMKEKLKTAEEFFRGLEMNRARIRALSEQLDQAKGVLNAEVNVAHFIKLMSHEAKQLGVTIKKVKPDTEVKRDYYIEVPFTVEIRGAYIQVLVLFDRIARFQQLTKVDSFNLVPIDKGSSKYVELNGALKVVSYKYLGTPADDIVKKHALPAEGDAKK